MNDKYDAWLKFIYYRDMLYLMAWLAALAGIYWYRFSRGRLWPLYAAGGCVLTMAGLAWGMWQLW